MKITNCLLAFVFCCLSVPLNAQESTAFPTNYFKNPLDIPILLAGGYGECRPDHFHTGIDIKTNGKENLPVHAAADGYISRISISSTGYGNCLYVTHPNGYTTVYGHLNDFFPELQQWMIEQQYRQQKWAVNLFPEAGQFPVKQGQVIAWSGTTGGSTGPHLHFEIRNTQSEHVLNELLFGLPYQDNLPPSAQSVAIYDGRKSIYMQSPQIESLHRTGIGKYQAKPAVIILKSPEVFLGIHAEDYMNGSNNWMGIYKMKLLLDGKLQAETLLRELDFSYARYANAYADYKTHKDKDVWYQGLYKLPDNQLDIYPFLNQQDGKLNLSDGLPHQVAVELYDPKGNKSVVNLVLKYDKSDEDTEQSLCGKGIFWHCKEANSFADSLFSFQSGKDAFYDDLCFTYSESNDSSDLSPVVQVMNTDIPIQSSCRIALKLNRKIPDSLQSKIAFVHHVKSTRLPGNNPQNGMAAQYEAGWATAKVRTFGNYYGVIDTVAPEIISYQASGKTFTEGQSIRFKATDALTSVATFDGYLNGKWLRFVRAGDSYTYSMDAHCPTGNNQLEIRAIDENGNLKVLTYNFVNK